MHTRPMYSNTSRPVSDKQRNFIEKLMDEKNTDGTKYAGWVPDWSRATGPKASEVIGELLALPRRTAPSTRSAEPEAGIYKDGDRLFRVYFGQQSGNMLVKEVTLVLPGTPDAYAAYKFLGRATRCLPVGAVRLSMDEVGSLGVASRHCLLCGRPLDDPESVDRGIGPVCASKY